MAALTQRSPAPNAASAAGCGQMVGLTSQSAPQRRNVVVNENGHFGSYLSACAIAGAGCCRKNVVNTDFVRRGVNALLRDCAARWLKHHPLYYSFACAYYNSSKTLDLANM